MQAGSRHGKHKWGGGARLQDGVGQELVAGAIGGVEGGRAAQEGQEHGVAHVGVGHRERRVRQQAAHRAQVARHQRARLRANCNCYMPSALARLSRSDLNVTMAAQIAPNQRARLCATTALATRPYVKAYKDWDLIHTYIHKAMLGCTFRDTNGAHCPMRGMLGGAAPGC